MSLSCIVQTLWDLQVIIEATIPFCHLDKNGCKLEQKHSIKKLKKICRVAHGLKKRTKTREMLSSLCHKKYKQQSEG